MDATIKLQFSVCKVKLRFSLWVLTSYDEYVFGEKRKKLLLLILLLYDHNTKSKVKKWLDIY